MTTPPTPEPPQPPGPPPPGPPPPAPSGPPEPPEPKPPDDLAELRATLDAERKARKELEAELARLREQGMSEQERAMAKAREEGKAEAEQAAALKLVAAEFRIAARDRIANPEAALAALDLAKLLGKDGQPDAKAIAALVDQLAAVRPAPGRVPAGPREPASDGDWLRAQMQATR
jgi:flagellar biosynthesis/type III secretory pathway protein FliH